MQLDTNDRLTAEQAADVYGLDGWGAGYLAIGADGHLRVTPPGSQVGIDLCQVAEELRRRGLQPPYQLRFPQLLRAQIDRLAEAFTASIKEFEYPESFHPVYPVKVNQQRCVVEGLLDAGRRHSLGLEVGSRPELLLATSLEMPDGALVVCNGFKDPDYLRTAQLAAQAGKQVVVVVEKPFELDAILKCAREEAWEPLLGFRIRLQARGSGLWEKSGGFASKFGLTTGQLLQSLERVGEAGLESKIALLHFHIGSQITEIRKVKNAVREASRIYAKLRKRGVAVRYLDVGGGLGVDYDGSRTSSDASVNYTVQEYANDIVFGIQEVCVEEGVRPPAIVSESGRMLVGYHSLLIAEVLDCSSGRPEIAEAINGDEGVVGDLADVERKISVKNYREFYHDALAYREQMYSLFNLGMLGLLERARGESLFASIAHQAVHYSRSARHMGDEFLELAGKLHDRYICNFSVFQSLPDHWALDQLFPVLPIQRLNERPTQRARLVDITCDSDGSVDKFVDLREIKDALEVHTLNDGEPYYLAFALVGAYQDTMGDQHNLLGRVHEAEIVVDETGAMRIVSTREGESAMDALSYFGFSESELIDGLARRLERRVAAGHLDGGRAASLLEDYRMRLGQYTYLERRARSMV